MNHNIVKTEEQQVVVSWKERLVHDLITDTILPFEEYCVHKQLIVKKGNAWHIDNEKEVNHKNQILKAIWKNKDEIVLNTTKSATGSKTPKQPKEIDYTEFYRKTLSQVKKDFHRLFQDGFTQSIIYLQGDKNLQIISRRGEAGDKYFKAMDAYPKIQPINEDHIENFRIALEEVFGNCNLTIG